MELDGARLDGQRGGDRSDGVAGCPAGEHLEFAVSELSDETGADAGRGIGLMGIHGVTLQRYRTRANVATVLMARCGR